MEATGCRWQGLGSSSSLFCHGGHSRKDTLFPGVVSLAQALILGRMTESLHSVEAVCGNCVYVSTLPGLCLLLGWKRPAKTSRSPRWLCGRPPPASLAIFLPGWRSVSHNSFGNDRSFPGRVSDGLGNTFLPFGVALQIFQARVSKSLHLVQILGYEHR